MKINGHSANMVVCGSRKRRVTDISILNTWSSRVGPSLRLSCLGMDVWLRCPALSIVVVGLGLFFRLLSGGECAQTRLTQNNLPEANGVSVHRKSPLHCVKALIPVVRSP